jgi:hypothetical protein
MKPTRCPACQSDDLAHGRLTAYTGLFFHMGFFTTVGVSGAACLACGAVIPYLDDTALNSVRTWSGRTTPGKATSDER